MRTTLLSIAVLFCAVLGACASTSAPSPSADPALKSARVDITPIAASGASMRVNGMSCPKCANNIERQLGALTGVQDVSIDLGAGLVRVGFTPDETHPSRADLANAIDRTGFTLVSIDAGESQ